MVDKALKARVRSQRWFERFPRAAALSVFALVFCATALSVFSIERTERSRIQEQAMREASEIANSYERLMSSNATLLRAGAAIVAIEQSPRSSTFEKFIEDLAQNPGYLSSLGVGWAPIVDRRDLTRFEQQIRAEGLIDFQVRPARSPQRYATPIVKLTPASPRNMQAIGYDMYSEPVRRAAMDIAIETSAPATSGKVRLVQENEAGDVQDGFLMYMPVFAPNRAARGHLLGFVYSPFRARDFVMAAQRLYPVRDRGLKLYDGRPTPDNLMVELPADPGPVKQVDMPVNVGQHSWTLRVEMPVRSGLSPLAFTTLVFGMIVSLLLLLMTRLVTQHAEEDRQSLEWQARQASIRNSLTRELNHRVKNTLANVLSIIALTRRRSSDLDSFAEGLTGRIRALSATHDLLTSSEWAATAIRSVVEAELTPYSGYKDGHLHLEGPDLYLAPNDALSLGLAIHELATNAAKYGALSVTDGEVDVKWRPVDSSIAEIRWQERNGPPVLAPAGRGFGLDLIEKIVSHELKSKVELSFDAAGVVCILRVPTRTRSEFELRARRLPNLIKGQAKE